MSSSLLQKEALRNASTIANDLRLFLHRAVTPFHVIKIVAEMLREAGFCTMQSTGTNTLCASNFFMTKNDSALIAVARSGKYNPRNGATIVAAHTDSPNLMLKPKSIISNQSYESVAVQCYGGGLWHTWFDRDLSIAGRMVLENPETKESKSRVLSTHLVDLRRPVLHIPNLAIHLQSSEEREAFRFNKEKHIRPVLCTALSKEISGTELPQGGKHDSGLLQELLGQCDKISENVAVLDADLMAYDTAAPGLIGLYGEFLRSARLDNLVSCYCAVKALIDSLDTIEQENMARIVVLYDHEEVGSASLSGAHGTLLQEIIPYLTHSNVSSECIINRDDFLKRSFCISADGAHGLHPNYPDKHNAEHSPYLQGGPVLKHNCNMRYATDACGASVARLIAKSAEVPLQDFVVRNDSSCGSTIGPILSSQTGIRTVDIGVPMWAMHSIRETCGIMDVFYLHKLLVAFFSEYGTISWTS